MYYRGMVYAQQLQQIVDLPFDTETVIFTYGEYEIYVLRPSKLKKNFEGYDPARNFQVWLREGEREFKPNHLRVMIDLYLRVRSTPALKRQLAEAMEAIFAGEDPSKVAGRFPENSFEHFLQPLVITLYLSQLFIIEQAHGYAKESRYNPRTLFYQGWVRQIICTDRDIDNLLISLSRGQPPNVGYTSLSDQNHKKYDPAAPGLWWFS